MMPKLHEFISICNAHLTGVWFSSMPNFPPCPNHIEGTCPRSDIYIEKEGDSFFTFRCRTCKSSNVFPKEKDENAGRYQSWLKHQAARTAQYNYESSRPEYSFAADRRKNQ